MSANRGAYFMAKMTGRGLSPEVTFGGIASIDRMDVAAACAKLSGLEYYILRVKYCADLSSAAKAVGVVEEYLSQASPKLSGLDQPRRAAMAALMLQELVSENRCRKCRGVGTIQRRNEAPLKCSTCEGSGRRNPSALSRANACGIPESTWRYNRIGEAFNQMMSKLESAEAYALETVSRKVS